MLRCVVMCCDVLCCVALFFALCCAVLCCAALRVAVLCFVSLGCDLFGCAVICVVELSCVAGVGVGTSDGSGVGYVVFCVVADTACRRRPRGSHYHFPRRFATDPRSKPVAFRHCPRINRAKQSDSNQTPPPTR